MAINPNISATPRESWDVDALCQGISQGDRTALSRAITLIESNRQDDRHLALELLSRIPSGEAIRLGITGNPGAGKSTFIEALGLRWTEAGHRVAVLAIDPSSSQTGGSILGDKTRMEALSRAPQAFIRPSSSGGLLGGVARRTRETIALCEAAGFDRIIIETVGVGQNETAVQHFTDCMLMLAIPSAGDELQGIKRGIMEVADVIAINKADGDLKGAAQRSHQQIKSALRLFSSHEHWLAESHLCSAITGMGMDDVDSAIDRCIRMRIGDGSLTTRRQEQALLAFEEAWRAMWMEQALQSQAWMDGIQSGREHIQAGTLSVDQALLELIANS